MSGGKSGGEQGRRELGKQEAGGGVKRGRRSQSERQVGPFLSSFPFCFSLPCCHCAAGIPPHPCLWCALHSHAPNLVHTMSTSHLHYLVQVGMLLFTNPLRGKVTKLIYWGRFLASCDMNWALVRELNHILVGHGPPSIIVLSVHISKSKSAHVYILGDEACIRSVSTV